MYEPKKYRAHTTVNYLKRLILNVQQLSLFINVWAVILQVTTIFIYPGESNIPHYMTYTSSPLSCPQEMFKLSVFLFFFYFFPLNLNGRAFSFERIWPQIGRLTDVHRCDKHKLFIDFFGFLNVEMLMSRHAVPYRTVRKKLVKANGKRGKDEGEITTYFLDVFLFNY